MHCSREQCMRAMLLKCLHAYYTACSISLVTHARPPAFNLQALAAADKERQVRQAEAGRAAKAAKLAEQVLAALPCLSSSPSRIDNRTLTSF